MATQRNHQNNFATNLTSNQIAGVTTTPLNSIPSVAAPFSIALDATNLNGNYEIVEVSSKTATNINHPATTYAHTTAEEVRMVVGATELDEFAAKTDLSNAGWISYSAVTPTYTSADDPTYTITFAAVDLTSVMGVGMKVKFTNNATTFYGFITAIAFSTNTVVTLYGGTDYDVANLAISAFNYSSMKAPLGFPLDPTKWTVITTDVSARSQAAPTVNVWYNLGSMSQTIPIGVWLTSYQVYLYANDNTGTILIDQGVTFSTANNSESDTDFTAQSYMYVNSAVAGSHGTTFHRSKTLVLAAKTQYYLNARAIQTAPSGSFTFGNDYSKMVIRSICAYL